MLNEIALHRIIVGSMNGQDEALDQLFGQVCAHMANADLSPLGAAGEEPELRTEIAARALGRLLARRCKRLRLYLDEPDLRFSTLLSVVVARVVEDCARELRGRPCPSAAVCGRAFWFAT